MRRDSPQASRSRHCRAGRLILSLLIPGCSVAGDQDPSRFPVRARCRVGVPECKLAGPRQRPSVPSPREDGFCGGWLRVQLEQPGVPLLCRLCPRRAEGRGQWRSPCSDTLVWACSSAEMSMSSMRISMHRPAYSLTVWATLSAITAHILPPFQQEIRSVEYLRLRARPGTGARYARYFHVCVSPAPSSHRGGRSSSVGPESEPILWLARSVAKVTARGGRSSCPRPGPLAGRFRSRRPGSRPGPGCAARAWPAGSRRAISPWLR